MTTSSTPQRPLGDRVSSVANWSIGLLVAHGAIGLIFGILVLSSPSKATNVITPFVGYLIAFWLIDSGATEIAAVARLRRDFPGWGWDMFFGVLTLIAGIVLLFVPVGTGFFVALLALWLIAFAVLFRAVALLNHGRGWGIGVGIIYAIFAVIMIWLIIANPGKSVEALVWTAGLWGVVSGITSLVLAWQLQAVRSAFSQRY
ncbi:HdeD family acid-resistance protein [Corynebacterium jeddahense]|mgnify:FL=1|uniref:HdeD family acid-resistance protein n=1 Tax=Corynebacterium jeddahense TaxID=1414719 RepID=A0ABY7ULH3_9CORY|nr:DUF308 domain-containing protein [Corynebacterium jeddahense]WCZ38534.1 hypothetical protein CJEDD_04605 [Corynebacterium jeddahense]